MLIQASHVGHEPEAHLFGPCRRLQTEDHRHTPTCGKIHRILEQEELVAALHAESAGNPVEIDLEAAIRKMSDAREVRLDA